MPSQNAASVNGFAANAAKPNKKKQVISSAADSVSFSDSVARRSAHSRTSADSVSFSDSVVRHSLAGRSLADALSFSDQTARRVVLGRSQVDSLTFRESFTAVQLRSVQDTMSFS